MRAAESAGAQGSFFEYHHLLFERQSDWRSLQGDAVRERLVAYAVELGLDRDQFIADLDSTDTAARAAEAYEHAVALGLQGTPAVFLNGRQLDPRALDLPLEQWVDFIEGQKAIASLPRYERPPMTIDPVKQYTATVETEKGTFVIELFVRSAPMAVNSFVFLAHEGWYDGVTFHRVISGFMAQTGDPSGTGAGGPGYTFEDEIDPEVQFDSAGLVAMANAGSDSNGSQWFITYAPQPHLNGLHTIFGRVIQGMEVVDSLTLHDPQTSPTFDGDKIISVTIEEK